MPTVRVFGAMRERLGARSVEVDARNVRELLGALGRRDAGALGPALFDDPASPEPEPNVDLRVLVNGRSIEFLDGLDTALERSDRVTLHHAGARGYPGG